jgi:general secretion pathway protein K
MDWKDPDDFHRVNGAESAYYQSLPNPYKAKNARFDTIEELLLVKGMTSDILYGTPEKTGISHFLTVNAKSTTININAAPKEVLAAIPGSSPEIADGIISYRQNKEIQSLQDVSGILGNSLNIMLPYLSTEGSGIFTIDSFGHKGDTQRSYAIRATLLVSDTEDTHRYLYYKSPASIQP